MKKRDYISSSSGWTLSGCICVSMLGVYNQVPVWWRSLLSCQSASGCSPGSLAAESWPCPGSVSSVWGCFPPWWSRTGIHQPWEDTSAPVAPTSSALGSTWHAHAQMQEYKAVLKKKEKVFIQSYTQLISFELILKHIWFSFVRAKLCSFADADYNFLDKGGKICKTNRHAAIKQCPGCQMHD